MQSDLPLHGLLTTAHGGVVTDDVTAELMLQAREQCQSLVPGRDFLARGHCGIEADHLTKHSSQKSKKIYKCIFY